MMESYITRPTAFPMDCRLRFMRECPIHTSFIPTVTICSEKEDSFRSKKNSDG